MLKPSKRHFILYDAQTYEQTGLTQVLAKFGLLMTKIKTQQTYYTNNFAEEFL